jgi:hypothetical protein
MLGRVIRMFVEARAYLAVAWNVVCASFAVDPEPPEHVGPHAAKLRHRMDVEHCTGAHAFHGRVDDMLATPPPPPPTGPAPRVAIIPPPIPKGARHHGSD